MRPEAAEDEFDPSTQTALAEAYLQKAADQERETEAEEWAESLVGDILERDPTAVQGSGLK